MKRPKTKDGRVKRWMVHSVYFSYLVKTPCPCARLNDLTVWDTSKQSENNKFDEKHGHWPWGVTRNTNLYLHVSLLFCFLPLLASQQAEHLCLRFSALFSELLLSLLANYCTKNCFHELILKFELFRVLQERRHRKQITVFENNKFERGLFYHTFLFLNNMCIHQYNQIKIQKKFENIS